MIPLNEVLNYFLTEVKKKKISNKKDISKILDKCLNVSANHYLKAAGNISEITSDIIYLDLSESINVTASLKNNVYENVNILDISNSKTSLDEITAHFPNTNILIAKNCGIKNFENALPLENLLIADFSENNISNFQNLELNRNLLGLTLRNNNIKKISAYISDFKSILKLDLSENLISEIDNNIWALPLLSSLNLKKNKINNISFPDTENHNLKYLNLAYNQLDDIDVNITNLINLKQLFLNSNKLQYLPYELSELKKLDRIYFKSNPFNKMPELKNVASLNLFSFLSKNNDKTYETEWVVPKDVRTAFLQYLLYFPDFVEKQCSKQITFNLSKTSKGIKISTKQKLDISIEDINKYLRQYIDILKYSNEELYEIAEHIPEKKSDYFKIRGFIREVVREKNFFSDKINEYFDKLTLLETDSFKNEKIKGLEFQIKYFDSLSSDLLKIIYRNNGVLKENFVIEITDSSKILTENNA